MDIAVLDNPPYDAPFRLVTIDGAGTDTGIDQSLGRVVCINGTGDLPLAAYTIDASRCSAPIAEIRVDSSPPPLAPLTPVPEPSAWALVAFGLLGIAGWKAKA